MSPEGNHSDEDQLLEQWEFLDAMLDRQSVQLQSGVQDDDDQAPSVIPAAGESELAALTRQAADLEAECQALGRHLDVRTRDMRAQIEMSEARVVEFQIRIARNNLVIRELRVRQLELETRLRDSALLPSAASDAQAPLSQQHLRDTPGAVLTAVPESAAATTSTNPAANEPTGGAGDDTEPPTVTTDKTPDDEAGPASASSSPRARKSHKSTATGARHKRQKSQR